MAYPLHSLALKALDQSLGLRYAISMEIEKEKFWKQNQWLTAGGPYSSKQVIEGLAPFITDERKVRIEQVLKGRTRNMIPIMENIYDRGNISAAMRSAESYGFFEFHIIEAEDAKFKSANRVTQGADKWLEVYEHTSTTNCIEGLKNKGYQVFCTHLEASKPISTIDFTKPTALIFGNEKDGVTKEAVEASDGNIILPMVGFSQSFNISVAAALSFYHAWLMREQELGKSGDLSSDEIEYLKSNYFYKAVKNPDQLLSKAFS